MQPSPRTTPFLRTKAPKVRSLRVTKGVPWLQPGWFSDSHEESGPEAAYVSSTFCFGSYNFGFNATSGRVCGLLRWQNEILTWKIFVKKAVAKWDSNQIHATIAQLYIYIYIPLRNQAWLAGKSTMKVYSWENHPEMEDFPANHFWGLESPLPRVFCSEKNQPCMFGYGVPIR